MKKAIGTISIILISHLTFSQVINEGFEGGIPWTWTQSTEDPISWIDSEILGVDESGAAIVNFDEAWSHTGSVKLETPFQDLTNYTDVTITFDCAIVRNNFLAPSISLWYDIGEGWEFLTNWGEFEDFENIIMPSNDYDPPLDYENINWVTGVSYDLSEFSEVPSIRFALSADFSNGGYITLDNLNINGELTNLSIDTEEEVLNLYPNPSTGILWFEKNQIQINELKIYDVSGKIINNLTLVDQGNLVMVDLSQHEKGTYLFSVVKSNGVHYSDLIIVE